MLETPELCAALQMGSDKSRAEGENHPQPAGHDAFGAAQDSIMVDTGGLGLGF